MVEKKTIGIAALILMLAGTSGLLLYQNVDLSSPTYYCESKMDLGPMKCVKFSTTGTRCYPSATTTAGYKDCSIGWTEIKPEVTTTSTTSTIESTTTTSIIITTTILNDNKYYCCTVNNGCFNRGCI